MLLTRACLLDVNIWLALTFSSHPAQKQAQELYQAATSATPICFCRSTQQSYLRLITNQTIWQGYGSKPIHTAKALELLGELMAQPEVEFLDEPDGVWNVWRDLALLDKHKASPKMWMDAYLAAFAMCGRISLATLDADFEKYQPRGLDLILL